MTNFFTLEQIKEHWNDDAYEFLNFFTNELYKDGNHPWTDITSTNKRYQYADKIAQKDEIWINFGLYELFAEERHLAYNYIDTSTETGYSPLQLGSTKQIKESLDKIEKEFIKGRKHFYGEYSDEGIYLTLYEPKSLIQFIYDCKEKYKKNDSSIREYRRYLLDVAEELWVLFR